MPPRALSFSSPSACKLTPTRPVSLDGRATADEITYLQEDYPLASPYRITKSVLMEKGDDSETFYSYRGGYGGVGQYEETQASSWKERLLPFKSSTTEAEESSLAIGKGNETQQIGIWLASQYYFRQAVYLISIGLLLWTPGLVALGIMGANASNGYNRMLLFGAGTFWWSIWLSSAWFALWICYGIATIVPSLSRRWVGVLSIALKRYISYAESTRCYTTLALWSLFVWIIYVNTVLAHFPGYSSIDTAQIDPLTSSNSSTSSIPSPAPILIHRGTNSISTSNLESNAAWLTGINRLLCGMIICSSILLAEKVLIQSIALSFHQTTYQDRIKQSNEHINTLTRLISCIPRSSSIEGAAHFINFAANRSITAEKKENSIARRARKFKAAEASRKKQTYGDPCDGMSIMTAHSPFSLSAYVEAALEEVSMSQEMANQIFTAFAHSANPKSQSELREADIRSCYEGDTEAHQAFLIFDRDSNGSCTWEEFQASVIDMHKERICLLASLHDVDFAVLKLDNFFMSFYLFLCCIIIAALLSSKFSTLVASLGTIMLGLSWLVGSAAQESLNSIIWVFGKHPIDVGDVIEIPGLLSSSTSNSTPENIFTVQEIQLLSTVLKTTTGKLVLVSNFQLAQRPIVNIRRSGPMEELFIINVEYGTPLDKVDLLREKMLEWIKSKVRDFSPTLSIQIDPLRDQSALSLKFDIHYKSNWQDGHLKATRRNDWMTALKTLMAALQIKAPLRTIEDRC